VYWRLVTSDECRVPEWEGLRAFLEEISAKTHTTPAVFVRVANKGVAGYGTWKCVRRMEDGSATEARRPGGEEEGGSLVSNAWLTIIATPPPCFL